MTKVICISGKAQSGKDTTASLLAKLLISHGKSARILHNADLLKYICKTFLDWNGEKDERGRTLLQYVGTDIIRKECPDYWVDFLTGIVRFFHERWDYVIIPDTRFPNELAKWKKEGHEVIHIRVHREYDNGLSEMQSNHPSELAMDDYPYDYYIENTTLDKLEEQVNNIVEHILGE